jgi:hypothetical protein
MTQTPPRPLVEGPSAWIGCELRGHEDEWIYSLSAAEIAEIENATAGVRERGLDIADIHRADFPLPTLGARLDRMRGEILDGRGFVLIRGLPVKGRPIADSAAAYWGIGAYFGNRGRRTRRGICWAMCAIWALRHRTRTCAPTRRPSGSISTPIHATSSGCCA